MWGASFCVTTPQITPSWELRNSIPGHWRKMGENQSKHNVGADQENIFPRKSPRSPDPLSGFREVMLLAWEDGGWARANSASSGGKWSSPGCPALESHSQVGFRAVEAAKSGRRMSPEQVRWARPEWPRRRKERCKLARAFFPSPAVPIT